MTTSERVLARLRADGRDVPDGARLIRVYAGYWQRAQGAWSWHVVDDRGLTIVGSVYAAGDLLRCRAWRYSDEVGLRSDVDVDPCRECERIRRCLPRRPEQTGPGR